MDKTTVDRGFFERGAAVAMVKTMLFGTLFVMAACSGSGGGGDRETFEIMSYRFEDNEVIVEAQRPGDPGCHVQPKLAVELEDAGLRLSVSYLRTSQEFCITPCPLGPLTLREVLPDGSSGQMVILDEAPTQRACAGVSGGPARVP